MRRSGSDRGSVWYPVVLVAAALAVSAWAYPRLPARVPTHFALDGTPNGWSGRTNAALEIPALIAALAVLFRVLPRLDPRRAGYAKFDGSYRVIAGATLGFLCVLHVLLVASAAGVPLPLQRLVSAAIGLLLVTVGNVLPRVRPNWVVGVRTPWLLADGEGWAHTQRLGGYVLVGGGLLYLVDALVQSPAVFALATGGTVAGVLGTVLYSLATSTDG